MPLSLAPGQVITASVSTSEPASIDLEVRPGSTPHLLIYQDEPSLIFRAISGHNQELATIKSGYSGLMLFSFPAGDDAPCRLVVEAPGAGKSAVQVVVRWDFEPISSQDLAKQMTAEQIFASAQAERADPTAKSLNRAIALYQHAQDLWRLANSSSGQSLALAAQAEVWFQMSKYDKALGAYTSAQHLVKPQSQQYVSVLNGQAGVFIELWRRDEALKLADRALELSRPIHDVIGEEMALVNKGTTEYLLVREDADPDLKHALSMAQARGNRVAAARVLSLQAWQARDSGQLAAANDMMGQSEELFQHAGKVVEAVGEMNDIATLDSMRGDVYSAIVRHLKISKLFHEAGDVNEEADTAFCTGLDYLAINRPSSALEYFKLARRLASSINNAWSAQEDNDKICSTELTLSLLDDAQSDCQESKKFSLASRPPIYQALAEERLGKLAELRKRDSIAFENYERSAKLSAGQHYVLGEALALVGMGRVKLKAGSYAAAVTFFNQALRLSQRAEDPGGIIDARYQIARTESRMGQLKDAKAELDEAVLLFETQRLKVQDDKLRTSYFTAVKKCYDLYVEILMQQHASSPQAGFDRQALQKSEASRARTLLDALDAARDSSNAGRKMKSNPELARLHAALDGAYENRLNFIVHGRNQQDIQRNEAEIRRLTTAYNEAEDLAKEQTEASANGRLLTVDELLLAAPKHSLILEYALGDEQSYGWLIHEGKLTSLPLPSRQIVTEAVERWRDLVVARQRKNGETFSAYRLRVQAADRALPSQASKLSCMLLSGVDDIPNSRLIVIADGVLQSVPFAALPLDGCNRQDGPPLLTRYEVVNLPSINVMIAADRMNRPEPSFQGDVAILADPVFSATDPRVTKPATNIAQSASPLSLQYALRDVGFGSELPRLNATRLEAQAIASAVPASKVFLSMDFDANLQTALSDELTKYKIWHFATHGLMDVKAPDLSGLVFSLVDQEGRPTPGYLKTQDIFDLSINPELVVLSACNSGLGEQVEGEGTVGLSYAFLHAGAKQVVSTLWNVDDKASSDLMAEFYRGMLAEHLSPSAALRKAQNTLSLRKRNSEVFYWAGYVLSAN